MRGQQMTHLAGPSFQFTLSYGDSHWRLAATGELDLASADTVVEVAGELAHHHPRALDLDLSGVTFIDSAGCTGLAIAIEVLQCAGVSTELVAAGPAVKRFFDLVRHVGPSDEWAGRGLLEAPTALHYLRSA
jgi:anti-anti-sigma factor